MSHDKHQAFFDLLADEWDHNFTAEDLERLSHLVDRLEIRSGMDIIDLGCGTGILFDLIRRRIGPQGSVTGVDFSLAMAQRAHRNFPFENVNVVDSDVTALPFAGGIFDMAVAFGSFAYFSDQAAMIAEVHRVLKPDGCFHIIYLTSSKGVARINQQQGGIVKNDKLPSADRLREMLNENGFAETTIRDQPGLFLASGKSSK